MSLEDVRWILALTGFVAGVTSLVLHYVRWRLQRKLQQQKWEFDNELFRKELEKDNSKSEP